MAKTEKNVDLKKIVIYSLCNLKNTNIQRWTRFKIVLLFFFQNKSTIRVTNKSSYLTEQAEKEQIKSRQNEPTKCFEK